MKTASAFVSEIQSTTNPILVLKDTVRFWKEDAAQEEEEEGNLDHAHGNGEGNAGEEDSFQAFLSALQSNEHISKVICHGQLSYGVTQEEWNQTIITLGRIPQLRELEFAGDSGPNVPHLAALAKCIQGASQLSSLVIGEGVILYGNPDDDYPSLCQALASCTSLKTLIWAGRLRLRNSMSTLDELCQNALAHCPNLERFCLRTEATLPTSREAIRQLLSLRHSLVHLELKTAEWGSVADAFVSSPSADAACTTLETLQLHAYEVRQEQVLGLISAVGNLSSDRHRLRELHLRVGSGMTDDVARTIFQSFGNNKNSHNNPLQKLALSDEWYYLPKMGALTVRGFKTLIQLLRTNHSLELDLTGLSLEGLDEENNTRSDLIRAVHMEMALNKAGRGDLFVKEGEEEGNENSNTKGPNHHVWLRVYQHLFIVLAGNNDEDAPVEGDPLLLDCTYELLRINPALWAPTTPRW